MATQTASDQLIADAVRQIAQHGRRLDARTARTAQLYVAALRRPSDEPKNFQVLARLAAPSASPRELALLASRMQRLVVDLDWDPLPVLRASVDSLGIGVTWRARVLTTVLVKKLWHRRLRDPGNASQQFATHLRVVGDHSEGHQVTATLAWRLAIDEIVWGRPYADLCHRRNAGIADDRCDPVGDIGHELIDVSNEAGLQGVPIVAGCTYYPTRAHWLTQGVSHVLEWPPNSHRAPTDDFPPAHYMTRNLDVRAPGVHDVVLVRSDRHHEVIVTADAPVTRQGRPVRTWLSNMHAHERLTPADIEEILDLAHLRFALHDDNQSYRDLGLDGYAGRSFDGWHRHAALVSVAFAAAQVSDAAAGG